MLITIEIQNSRDFQWLQPFLDALKKHPTVKVEVKGQPSDAAWEDKLAILNKFVQQHAITVDKIIIPSREERNAR